MTIAGYGVIDGGVVAILVMYFWFVSKDWEPWYLMCILIQIGIIVGLLWLPESPDFLYAKGRYDESKEVLMRIAKWNGAKITEDQLVLHPQDAKAHQSYEALKTSAINSDPGEVLVGKSGEEAEMKHTVGTMKELIGEREIMINLALMTAIWTTCSFTYYLAKFQLKFIAGNVFVNSLSSSVADALSRPVAYFAYKCMHTRRVMLMFFTISAVGSIPVMFSENASVGFKSYAVPACLWIANFGSCGNFSNLYIGHLDLFPMVFATTTMGICNVVARALTVLAPIVAEIKEPYPEITYTALCFVAAITSIFIRDKSKTFY